MKAFWCYFRRRKLDKEDEMSRLKNLKMGFKPEGDGEVTDIYTLPAGFFEDQVGDEQLVQLNRIVEELPGDVQRILHHHVSGIDPSLSVEALELGEAGAYWRILEEGMTRVSGSSGLQDPLPELKSLFARKALLLDAYLELLDRQDAEEELKSKKKKRRWGAVVVILAILLLVMVVFPLVFKPSPEAVFEEAMLRYPGMEAPEITAGDSLYYYAWRAFVEEDYQAAFEHFDQLMVNPEGYPAEAEWYLALLALRRGDRSGVRHHLRQLEVADPELYRLRGRWLRGRI